LLLGLISNDVEEARLVVNQQEDRVLGRERLAKPLVVSLNIFLLVFVKATGVEPADEPPVSRWCSVGQILSALVVEASSPCSDVIIMGKIREWLIRRLSEARSADAPEVALAWIARVRTTGARILGKGGDRRLPSTSGE